MKRLLTLLLGAQLLAGLAPAAAQTDMPTSDDGLYFVSTSFHEPADEGLRFIYSRDGLHWDSIPGTWLPPLLGDSIMRDPSVWPGPDGTYHLVWTIAWRGDTGIGYSSSKDLVHWTPQRRIPVMDSAEHVHSVWAPELFYDDTKGEYLIVFSALVNDGTSAGGGHEHGDYHRMYYVTTSDFETFSPPALFYDAGYSCIDGIIVKRAEGSYVLIAKDNRKANSNLRVAFSKRPEGPYSLPLSAPFTGIFAEGPSVTKAGDTYYIYYDLYRLGRYGASATKDFIHFTDVTSSATFPPGHKHGTVFKAPTSVVEALLREARKK